GRPVSRPPVGSYLHHFTFAAVGSAAVYFLWHFPWAHARRVYPALCSAELGLSSTGLLPSRSPRRLATQSVFYPPLRRGPAAAASSSTSNATIVVSLVQRRWSAPAGHRDHWPTERLASIDPTRTWPSPSMHT